MEEYAQFVDVEPLTAWERMEYFLAALRRHWRRILIFFVPLLLWGLPYDETSAVIWFLYYGVVATIIIIIGFPRARDVYVYRAWKHQLAGDMESAVANCRQALAVALKRYPRITTDTGQATRRVDRFYANTLYSLGSLYNLSNRPAEAETAFESALAVRPNDPLLLTGLGYTLLLQERDEDAQVAFDKALAAVSRTPRSQNILQRVAHSLKAIRRGVGWAWVQYADAFTVYVLIGDAYTGVGKYREAIAAYEQAFALNPQSPAPQHGLGNAYHGLGHYDEAIAAYQRALAGRGWPAEYRAITYCNLGDAYTEAGKYREAIAAYEQAIVLNPQSPAPQHGLGNAYDGLGHYDEAIAAYQRALAGRGWSAEYRAITYYSLGLTLLHQERLSEAQAALEQAIALNRRMGLGYVGLAYVYAEQGQYERALEQCQHASSLTPSSPATYRCLGRIYADQGRYEEAISELERAMDLEPHTGWAWLERARLETLRGDTEAALEYLAQALERGPRQAIRSRALEGKKLRPLHDHSRFRELVGESEEERPTTT